jgi:hypothetical protein
MFGSEHKMAIRKPLTPFEQHSPCAIRPLYSPSGGGRSFLVLAVEVGHYPYNDGPFRQTVPI